MISAANSSFSKRSDEVRELSLQVIGSTQPAALWTGRRRCPSEAARLGKQSKLEAAFSVKGQAPPSPQKGIETHESVQARFYADTNR